LEGQVIVICDDEFQCERLFVSIRGQELARVVVHAGKVTIVHEETREHINHQIDLGEHLTIPMGESHYDFSFAIPSDIPGSYKGPYGSIQYNMEAKAEISLARDLKSKQDILLSFQSEMDTDYVLESKSEFIERDGIILVKAETTRTHFMLGNEIDLRFFVDRDAKMRGIRVEIISIEHVEPKGHKMRSMRKLAEIYYPDEEIRRDSWSEVMIPTDSNWAESFSTELIEYRHIVKVTLDIPLRRDKNIEIPIILNKVRSTDDSVFDF
jgi:hypothetical protein